MRIPRQDRLLQDVAGQFPSTRYQGSKAKLVDWIWGQVCGLDFDTCLDAFGGTGCVAYRMKQEGKEATYNDILRFNHQFGLALIQNSDVRLSSNRAQWLLQRHEHVEYPTFVRDTFRDIYFTDEENAWIDQTFTNMRQLTDPYEFALAFFALSQACIIKRPYNLFHRKNLYMRLSDVERSFGNKATWDRPFTEWFLDFVAEANQAVFENGRANRALNLDALNVPGNYDLVYIDTPYVSKRGVGVDYRDFYHFLEGLTAYGDWGEQIDRGAKHLRLKRRASEWTDGKLVHGAFDRLFRRFDDSIIVVSYRSDGIPTEQELTSLLSRHKRRVQVEHYGDYKYVLSTNSESREILVIGT